MSEALPDDIRAQGWMVAVHNDYRLNGENHTFWLFTKGNKNLKGEGQTDSEALDQVREQISAERPCETCDFEDGCTRHICKSSLMRPVWRLKTLTSPTRDSEQEQD